MTFGRSGRNSGKRSSANLAITSSRLPCLPAKGLFEQTDWQERARAPGKNVIRRGRVGRPLQKCRQRLAAEIPIGSIIICMTGDGPRAFCRTMGAKRSANELFSGIDVASIRLAVLVSGQSSTLTSANEIAKLRLRMFRFKIDCNFRVSTECFFSAGTQTGGKKHLSLPDIGDSCEPS